MAKRKNIKKRVERRLPQRQQSAQPSVLIKIIFASTLAYLALFVPYFFLKLSGTIVLPKEILNFPASWVEAAVQVCLMAGFLTVFTKIFFINPLLKIRHALKNAIKGKKNAVANVSSFDEFGELAFSVNQMLGRVGELNKEKIELETDLKKTKRALGRKASLAAKGKDIKKSNRELESLVKDLSLLYEIGQSVNSTIEISELYKLIEKLLPKRLNLQKFAIFRSDDKREFLNAKAAYGFAEKERIFEMGFRMGEGICGQAALRGETIYVPNISAEDRFLHYRGEVEEQGSFLSIPLIFKRDVLGVINFSRSENDAFQEEEKRLLTLVANQIALAMENAQLYTKTRELSVRDELTGLYNRRHFQQVLKMEWKRATRFKRPLTLLMIDIDHFKSFNDTFGHLHGDKVLRVISHLIMKNLREVDTVARFGGEEFVILLPDTDKAGALVVGEKLRSLVEIERFNDADRDLMPLTISVGISVFPEDAKEMDDLIDHADVALYDAKDGGRNRVITYGPQDPMIPDLKEPRPYTS